MPVERERGSSTFFIRTRDSASSHWSERGSDTVRVLYISRNSAGPIAAGGTPALNCRPTAAAELLSGRLGDSVFPPSSGTCRSVKCSNATY